MKFGVTFGAYMKSLYWFVFTVQISVLNICWFNTEQLWLRQCTLTCQTRVRVLPSHELLVASGHPAEIASVHQNSRTIRMGRSEPSQLGNACN